MKTLFPSVVLSLAASVLGTPASLHAQISPSGPTPTSPADTGGYVVVDAGPHHRIWQRPDYVTAGDLGKSIADRYRYVELATFLNYRGADGAWHESQETFSILPDGSGAVALQGNYQVFAPADIYEGSINITLPSGEILRTRPLAISYFDGTNNFLIAELTNSVAQLSGDGRTVTWPSAFTDFQVNLVANYRRGAFECDIVFLAQPPAP
jgi:hypothetical protein